MPRPRISTSTPRARHRRLAIPAVALIALLTISACKPDPVTGQVKPQSWNTGWEHTGVTLSTYGGPMNITTNGTVIDSKDIRGQITVSADNVTIKRSRIRSNDFYGVFVEDGSTGLRIIDTELDGMGNPNNDSAVSSHDYTVTRGDVHGWVDGFKANSDVTIQNTWLHEFNTGYGNHNDGVQISWTGNINIIGNRFDARSKSEAMTINASVYTNTDYGVRPNNVVVRGNWINAGAHMVRIDATNFKLENNRFGPWVGYGLTTATSESTWTSNGNVWDETGKPIN